MNKTASFKMLSPNNLCFLLVCETEPEVSKLKAKPSAAKKEKTAEKRAAKEDRVLKEIHVAAKKEKPVEKKAAKEDGVKAAEPALSDSFIMEEDLPYFQCFFVDEDEAQFPFYAFSPLQI
ncbi:hypothetical protein JOB18_026849 [Solea senegalensis]|uniref:Uncharacterized protein n=1 Tax=Solea senegalensis TaxID=28829 RepID=A0AAV6S2L1_SOLSE|nr:hypothetical protein JOB18_026849 [Solea senegalensis]